MNGEDKNCSGGGLEAHSPCSTSVPRAAAHRSMSSFSVVGRMSRAYGLQDVMVRLDVVGADVNESGVTQQRTKPAAFHSIASEQPTPRDA